ncbi:MAG TPA: hypothetical protein VMY77_04000 [Chitinophagaceae bacterium]|nr:hypothetical protein [Chitinophagaceae bacterium]
MRTLLNFIVLFFLLPIFTDGQKPIIKIEIGAGFEIPSAGGDYFNGSLNIFYPILHIPLTQHFDIGVGYNSSKTEFERRYTAPPAAGSSYGNTHKYTYDISDKFWSGYLTYNFAKSDRRIIPSISYIISYAKGEARFPSNPYEASGSGTTPTIYSAQEKDHQSKLQTTLSKSEIAHGLQGGFDVRLSSLFSISAKARAYSLLINNTRAFPTLYSMEYVGSGNRNKFNAVLAVIFKIPKGKKSEIK